MSGIHYRTTDAARDDGIVTGGGSGAPVDAQYLVLAFDGTLTNERKIVMGTALNSADAGANGNFTINHAQVGTSDLHTEYIRAAGTRAFSGDQSFGGHSLTQVDVISAGSGLTGANETIIDFNSLGSLVLSGKTQVNIQVNGTNILHATSTQTLFDANIGLAGHDIANVNAMGGVSGSSLLLNLGGGTTMIQLHPAIGSGTGSNEVQIYGPLNMISNKIFQPNMVEFVTLSNGSPSTGQFWWDGSNLRFRQGGTTKTITWS